MPSSSSSSSSPHGAAATLKRASLLVPQAASSSTTTASSCSCCPCRPSSATTTVGGAAATAAQQQQRASTVVLCASCVHRFLQAARQRHQAVVEQHAVLQRACREKFTPPLQQNDNNNNDNTNNNKDAVVNAACNRLWQMQQEEWQQIWLPRWEYLRHASSYIAVQVARKKFDNEQRKESLQIMVNNNEHRRQLLIRWKCALLQTVPITTTVPTTIEQEDVGGSRGNDNHVSSNVVQVNRSDNGLGAMAMAVMEARQQVRRLRFQWALYAFQLHKLNVGDDHHHHHDNNNNNNNKNTTTTRDTAAVCRGIGKIGGCLPLPHAGPELYVFLPPPELQSALRLVASLTSMVAACLGILLPHPILLQHQSSSSLHDSSTTTKLSMNQTPGTAANSSTGGGGYSINNATPPSMAGKTNSFEYCRDLAMRGAAAAAAVEQPNDFLHHENEDWQEQPFPNVTPSAATTPATPATRPSSSSSSTSNKAAPTLSTSYLVSLAGQTFRRATGGGGGGGTPTAAAAGVTSTRTTTTLPASRTIASSSNNGTARITTTTTRTTTTRRQREVVGSSHNNNYTIPPPPSMDPASVERRIHHATAAVLAENEHGSLYTLAAPGTIISSPYSFSTGLEKRRTTDEISSSDDAAVKTTSNKAANCQQNEHHLQHHNNNATVMVDADHFAIALQLLQNNVICLCIRAGVPVTNLWPAQAVLLNLQALQEFCQEQTTSLSPILAHRR